MSKSIYPYNFCGSDKIPEMAALIGRFYESKKMAVKKAADFQRLLDRPFCILKASHLKGYLVVSQRQIEKLANQVKLTNVLK